jgi:hypothetical protein
LYRPIDKYIIRKEWLLVLRIIRDINTHCAENGDSLALNQVKAKGKAVPLQAWSGPEGARKLRVSDFMTTAQDGGKVVSPTHRPHLPPRKYSRYSFLLEAESTPKP